MANKPERLAQGRVRIDAEVEDFDQGLLSLYIEDTSLADGTAIRLGSCRLPGIQHRAGRDTEVVFAMSYRSAGPRADVVIRGHLCLQAQATATDREPDIASGDLVTTRAYPLADIDTNRNLTLAVTRVIASP